MLILQRKPGQSIWISDYICVTVLAKQYNDIRIGISAPKYIKILREELLQGKQYETVQNITKTDQT